MRTIIPRFNAERMVRQYVRNLYAPAARQHVALAGDGANRLAAWKKRIAELWPGVTIRRVDAPVAQISHGDAIVIELRAQLAGLTAADVRVECIVTQQDADPVSFDAVEVPPGSSDEYAFRLQFTPPFAGHQTYQIRMYPHHALLSHRFEMGRLLWI